MKVGTPHAVSHCTKLPCPAAHGVAGAIHLAGTVDVMTPAVAWTIPPPIATVILTVPPDTNESEPVAVASAALLTGAAFMIAAVVVIISLEVVVVVKSHFTKRG